MCSPNQPRRALKRASTSGSCSHATQCLQSRKLQARNFLMQVIQTDRGQVHMKAGRQMLLAFICSAMY